MSAELIYYCSGCSRTRTIVIGNHVDDKRFPDNAGVCVCKPDAKYYPKPNSNQPLENKMNRQPSRTDLVEAHEQKIFALQAKAIDAKTLSRAYADLADAIKTLPTRGDLWDVAKADIVEKALMRSLKCTEASNARLEEVEGLREQGVPS